MPAPDAFATLEDYSARYALPDDAGERVTALLADASALMRSMYEERTGGAYEQGAVPRFDDNATAVCCAVASRAMNVSPSMAGVTQLSQTTGPYSASATFANPTGDLYLSRGDLRRLGLAGCRVGSIRAMTRTDREGS